MILCVITEQWHIVACVLYGCRYLKIKTEWLILKLKIEKYICAYTHTHIYIYICACVCVHTHATETSGEVKLGGDGENFKCHIVFCWYDRCEVLQRCSM